MLYIDPLGLDTAQVYGYIYYGDETFKAQSTYEFLKNKANRDSDFSEAFNSTNSNGSNKRPLTPEELLAKRKAEEDRLRRIEYDSKRQNYGKGQTKEGLKTASDGLQNLGYVMGAGDMIVNNVTIGSKALKYLNNSTKALQYGGFTVSVANIVLESYMLKKGFISGGEFAYNTTGTITSTAVGLYVGATVGGGAGAIAGFAVGVTFPIAKEAGKIIYNSMNEGANQFRNQALNTWSRY